MPEPKRIVVAVTGASGAVYGVRLLDLLRSAGVETHLITSKWGARTLTHETGLSLQELRDRADRWYQPGDQGATVSSGSFRTDGMIIAPCSVRTVAAIASGQGDNLVHRAADVTIKESRKLVLMVRETPLSSIHLENMLKLSRMGVVMFPPVPAFYGHPETIQDLVDQSVVRAVDQLGINLDHVPRWDGRLQVHPEQT